MGSDRARVSYDEQRQYRAVVMQQGRVTVEADWNEAEQIVNEEMRKEALDFVGPSGTPDDGYRVIQTGSAPNPPFDFSVNNGTMYVGGLRAFLAAPVQYSSQLDWLDHLGDPDWVDPSALANRRMKREFIYLYLREQEVSAVEDSVLREVALGGPDTAQRLRLVQHIVRLGTEATDCATALAAAEKTWAAEGLNFDDRTMRLLPAGTLQASFQDPGTTPDPCEPQAHGGYLGADNQLIRIQISGSNKLTWGFDDASFLYRVTVVDNQTLQLQARPVDDFHKPRANQTVEVLRSAAQLSATDTTDYVATATGIVATLAAPYVPDTQRITLPAPLPPEYLDPKQTPVVFLRVWEEEKAFTPGTPVVLGQTGLQVTLQATGAEPFHIGDYWLIAVRPSTPTEIYPHRYLEAPQPPDGPRLWVCPLAVIEWNNGILNVLEDCRNPFDNLVDLTKRKLGGCCDVTVRPEDITEKNTLQSIIDKLKNQEQATVCLMPGVYSLPKPLLLGPEHSNLTLEGCHDGAVIQAAAGQETNFLQGLIVLVRADNVTLRNLRFELPQAAFGAATGRIANMEPAIIARILGAQLQNLYVSIGVRPLHCALLTIKDCLFRFSLTSGAEVFGAGILAGSECWGLTVQSNRFVREEDFLRTPDGPFRLLIGYGLTPTTTFSSGKSGPSRTTAVPAGILVRSLLQDASFQDNLFAGLSIAVLIYADANVIKFERNTVRDCRAGFWYYSLRSLAFAAFIDEVVVSKDQLATAQRLRNSLLAAVMDPITQIGSVIARGYPLPETFDISQAVRLETQKVSNTAKEERAQIQKLFNNALSLFAQAEGSGQEKVNVKEGAPTTTADTTFASVLGRFNTLNLHLSAFERAALMQSASEHGLHLSLHMSDNNIDARVTSMQSGIGLLVWDDEQDIISTMTISANKVQNQGQPTAVIIMVDCCAITGNIILNEPGIEIANFPRSLIIFPGPALPGGPQTLGAGVAVTGNVFGGTPHLPPRPAFTPPAPPPMDRWEFFNTAIYS